MVFSFVGSVSAITGSIGNARMILRPDIGDTIERSILVKNVNEVALDIELSAAGDLADEIEIIDSEFQLAAGAEKNAKFKIEVKKKGTTESKINVKFSPTDGGNGVGLSNIRQRIETLYGDKASLTITEHAEGGVVSTVLLPLTVAAA